MAITIGTKAPDFKLVTLTESGPQIVTLSEVIGKDNILLLFVPMAFTGGCTKEFCSISEAMPEYSSLGAVVYGITGDNPFANAAWAEKEGITLTLLSDYDHMATEAYGICYDSFIPEKNLIMSAVPKRSAFVIDKAGVVQYVEILESPSDMPNFTAIKECLAKLK